MPAKFINLMAKDYLKGFLVSPQNRRVLKYFLKTMVSLPEDFNLDDIEVFYQTLLNHYEKKEDLTTSDLIIKSRKNLVILKTYTTIEKEFIIHIITSNLDNDIYNLKEFIFTNNIEKRAAKEIINCFSPDLFWEYIQIKVIDLQRLAKLDNKEALNRWLKFIGASNEEERLAVTKEDELLFSALVCEKTLI